MAEIINLNRARKARAKEQAAAKASENRTRFGRTKAQKAKEKADADRIARTIDGAKREE